MNEFNGSVFEEAESAQESAAGGKKYPDGGRSALRAVFSRFSLVYLLAVIAFSLLSLIPDLPEGSWLLALLNTFWEDIWYYGPFFLCFALLLRRYPMMKQSDLPTTCSRPKILQILSVFLFASGLTYFFGFLSNLLAKFFGFASSGSSADAAYLLVAFFDAAIMVPILEELIFRRMLLDRLMFLGSGTALLLTSFFFSIAHMNHPSRLLYTFFVGLILGCVHVRTGKMRWNILLHMSLNAMSFVIGYMGSILGVLWIFGTMIFAAVYLIVRRPWRGIVSHEAGIPAREKFAACMSSVPFWITMVLLFGIAVLKNL